MNEPSSPARDDADGPAGPTVADGTDQRELRRAAYTALILLVGFNIADVVTTELLLDRGGIELNPLGQYLMTSHRAVVVKLVIVGLLFWDFHRRGARVITLCLLWLVVGIYLAVVVINGVQLVSVWDT